MNIINIKTETIYVIEALNKKTKLRFRQVSAWNGMLELQFINAENAPPDMPYLKEATMIVRSTDTMGFTSRTLSSIFGNLFGTDDSGDGFEILSIAPNLMPLLIKTGADLAAVHGHATAWRQLMDACGGPADEMTVTLFQRKDEDTNTCVVQINGTQYAGDSFVETVQKYTDSVNDLH